MKLDPTVFRYIDKDAFRVLTAVEMGMKNHQWVPTQLIESIAHLRRGSAYKMLCLLLKHKLVAHNRGKYDGYKLTYNGYDFLALRALVSKGFIRGVGTRIGVGKESDIHVCEGANGEKYALKLHRLGRVSFRTVKTNRDYLQHRQSASWMYMARLAAKKEFAYLKALQEAGFRVPHPIEQNRHAVLMKFVEAKPLYQVRELKHPDVVLERLMRLIVRLTRAGIIHGDFNEFNLMIDEKEQVTLIDFPQVVTTSHGNAEMYFDRDVKCIRDFFSKRYNIEVEVWPAFEEAIGSAPEWEEKTVLPPIMEEGEDALLTAAIEEEREHEKNGTEDESEEEDKSEEEDDELELEGGVEVVRIESGVGDEDEDEDEDGDGDGDDGGDGDGDVISEGDEEGFRIESRGDYRDAFRKDSDNEDDEESTRTHDGSDTEYDEENQPKVADQIGVLKKKRIKRTTAVDVRKHLEQSQTKRTARTNKTKDTFKRKAHREAMAVIRDS